MDFISNLIKRPISLVRNDSLPSTPTEQGQSNSRPTTPQHLHSSLLSFDRANSPEARQQHIINIMDTLNVREDFCSTTVSAPPTRTSSPLISQSNQKFSRSLQTSIHSNDSGSAPNSASASKTIEELLLQINDNLNMGDVNAAATQLSQHHLPNRPLSVSALTKVLSSELNAISSKSENPKGITPLHNSLASETAPAVMALAANNASSSFGIANKTSSTNIETKAGLSVGQVMTSNKAWTAVDEHRKLEAAGTDLDEIKKLEMATQLNLKTGDGVKIKFEDGLIPTLTAAINEHETSAQEKESNSTPSPYLQVNTESDTATSSDNEIFTECQSYQMVAANRDYLFVAADASFDNSEIDSYFSAANSRNTTLTNVCADPLSLTVNKAQEQNENEQDMQSVLSAINGGDMLAQQIIHPLDVTHEDEPMDVDVSFDESKSHIEVEQHNISASSLMKENNLPLDEVRLEQVTKKVSSSGDFEDKPVNDAKGEVDNTNNVKTPVAVSAEVEVDNKVPLDTSIEKPTSTSTITNGLEGNSDSSSTETASEVTADHTQPSIATNSPMSSNSANTSLNTSEENDIKKCILNENGGLAASHNALNVTIEMSTSISSCRSTGSSPNFPIKHQENLVKQFPRSPTAGSPKSMSFLEKSTYTERIETERKKSVVNDTQLNLSNSRNTFTVDKQHTLDTKPDKNTPNIVNSKDCKSNNRKDTSFRKGSHEDKPNGDVNENFDLSKGANLNDIMNEPLPSTIGSENENISSQNAKNECVKICASYLEQKQSDEKRRTFNISPPNKQKESDEKRRTFNIPPPIGVPDMSNNAEINVPMDLDDTCLTVAPVIDSHNNVKTPQAALESPTTTAPNSPPISTLLNRLENESSLGLSPPIPTLLNRFQAENEPATVMDTRDMNDDAFKVPLPPPPASSKVSPSPMPIIQQRPSIHAHKNTQGFMEALSAKEQRKHDASDEKDIFTGNCTPSPLEELPSSTCTFENFGIDPTVDVDQQTFANEEFQSGNDLFFNPSDFDYLLTKGNNNTPIDRSSILLKFDPLLGVPVPVNQVKQPEPQQVVNSKIKNLSPTKEEDEHSSSASISSFGNNQSFIVEVDSKRNSFGLNTTNERSVRSNTNSANTSTEKPTVKAGQHNQQEATLKKYASMSVDVIKDINIDNDCNKSFENSNTQLDEKQINYKMDELEKKIKNEVLKTEDIEKKLKEAEQREEALIKRITDKDKTITKMTGVIEAYEKAIAELIAEKEQLLQNYEQQLAEVKTDRDSNYQHLTSLETTFADLHVKYGKSKEMTMQLKTNEETLMAEKRQILENLRLQEQRYDKMKNHAMQQLEIANKKLETINKDHNIETTKLKALLKKEEISRASMNEQLQQKSRENEELLKICDELINGQGS